MIWIWVGVALILGIVEFISKKGVALCFVISAFISAVLTFFTGNYIIQLVQFIVVGMILVALLKPKIVKLMETIKNRKKVEET